MKDKFYGDTAELYQNPLKIIPGADQAKKKTFNRYQVRWRRRNGFHRIENNFRVMVFILILLESMTAFFCFQHFTGSGEIKKIRTWTLSILITKTTAALMAALINMIKTMRVDTIDPILLDSIYQLHSK